MRQRSYSSARCRGPNSQAILLSCPSCVSWAQLLFLGINRLGFTVKWWGVKIRLTGVDAEAQVVKYVLARSTATTMFLGFAPTLSALRLPISNLRPILSESKTVLADLAPTISKRRPSLPKLPTTFSNVPPMFSGFVPTVTDSPPTVTEFPPMHSFFPAAVLSPRG